MAVCKPQHHLCHSAWEDQRCWCANICHMALPARASPCQYVNSGMPAPLISHTLNEILALQNKSVQKLHCSNSFLVDSLIMAPCTWFTFVLHRAPLALDTYMLIYFRILWHKLVIVWLLVPHGKYIITNTYLWIVWDQSRQAFYCTLFTFRCLSGWLLGNDEFCWSQRHSRWRLCA